MGDNAQLTVACSSKKKTVHVFVFACMRMRESERKICWLIRAGMSDDWMIYSSEL